MVGPLTFAAAYFTAGVLGNLVGVSTSPLAVLSGATHGVLGVYGLAAASFVWDVPISAGSAASRLCVPWRQPRCCFCSTTWKRYELERSGGSFDGSAGAASCWRAGWKRNKPPLRRLSFASAAALVLAVAAAMPGTRHRRRAAGIGSCR